MRTIIVVADFYKDIADGLIDSCTHTLENAHAEIVSTIRVPGALEIPLALQIASKKNVDFLIALGCVIRGQTYHFEVVSTVSVMGIQQVQLKTGIPIGNGILTVENREQALERLSKGADAAYAAMSLAKIDYHL